MKKFERRSSVGNIERPNARGACTIKGFRARDLESEQFLTWPSVQTLAVDCGRVS